MDLTTLTDTQLVDLQAQCVAETRRRQAAPLVAAAQAQVVSDLRASGTITAPTPPANPTKATNFPAWKSPGTDHARMYLKGDRVSRNGRVWESRTEGLNSWEPGAAGVWETVWADVTDQVLPKPADTPAGPPAWAAGQAYTKGTKVTYKGSTYTVVQDHTSQSDWTPDAVASLYTKQ